MNPRNRYKAVKDSIVPHRRSSVVNPNSINPRNDSYTYDIQGNRTSVTIPWGNTLTSTYDPAGNRLTQVLADGRSGTRITNTYTYTNRNLIDTVTDFQGGRTRYTYDALGRKTRRELPSSLIDSYTAPSVRIHVAPIELESMRGRRGMIYQ